MNGIMNENLFVRGYEYIKTLIHKIDSLTDGSIRDCRNK